MNGIMLEDYSSEINDLARSYQLSHQILMEAVCSSLSKTTHICITTEVFHTKKELNKLGGEIADLLKDINDIFGDDLNFNDLKAELEKIYSRVAGEGYEILGTEALIKRRRDKFKIEILTYLIRREK